MKGPSKPVFYMLLFSAIILFLILLLQPWEIAFFRNYIAMLVPKGIIGLEERNLLFIIQAIMLLVIIPVYILTFVFSWKYRAGNTNAEYDPDLVDHPIAEVIWWGIPLVIVLAIAILTAIKTFELDPYKPLDAAHKTKTIQVVATQWNWLFIYPDEKIASLNFVQFPVDTPIHFEITADAPMNSFWIPQLGGQIYAMPKMRTELHLIASEAGDYRGSSANISGEYFADMVFIARASTEDEFHKWVDQAKATGKELDFGVYNVLSRPSVKPPELYNLLDEKLFHKVIMKFMLPQGSE